VIALGYEQPNKKYLLYYKFGAALACIVFLWTRFKAEFGQGNRKSRKA